MPRVLLVKCRVTNRNNRSVVPPLGAMYIAAVLREHGHEVRIADAAAARNRRAYFSSLIREFKPDVIGISAIVPEYSCFVAFAELATEIVPGVPIIVGGPLASSNPVTSLNTIGVTALVLGEGERTMVELVNALTSGGSPEGIAGTAFVKNDETIFSDPREPLSPDELDALPFPAWDLIDLKLYGRIRSMASVGTRRYMQVFTSRGCPFNCVYCHTMMGRRFRPRSPESVISEINILREKFDIHEFEIVDDCFNLDRPRMHAILKGIAKMRDRRLRLQFPNGLRSDLLTEEDIRLLRSAGTNFISFAIESASPAIQKAINKNLKIENAVSAIKHADRAGIFCNGFFMIGFPGETYEDAMGTVDLAVSTRLHQALFFLVTPFKGTSLYSQAREIINSRFQGMHLDDLDYFNISHNVSDIPDDRLKSLFSQAYRRFYLNPSRIVRILGRHPRVWQLPMYAAQFINKAVTLVVARTAKFRCRKH